MEGRGKKEGGKEGKKNTERRAADLHFTRIEHQTEDIAISREHTLFPQFMSAIQRSRTEICKSRREEEIKREDIRRCSDRTINI